MNKVISSFFKIIRTVMISSFKAAPFWMVIDIVVAFLSACCVAFKTIIMQMFFDTVNRAIGGNSSIQYLVMITLATFGVYVVNEILSGICNFTWLPLGIKIKGAFNAQIHDKVGRLEAIRFEEPETLDLITKAKQGVSEVNALYNGISTVFAFYLPYFIVIGVYLYKLRPLLLVSLFIIFVPLILTQIIRGKIFSKLVDETAPIKRKMEYYERAIYDREYFKETRILGIYGFIKKMHQDVFEVFAEKSWKASKQAETIEISMKLLTLLGYYGVVYLLFISLIQGYITVGAFVAVFASIGVMINYENAVVCNYLARMIETVGSLSSYMQFLDIPEYNGKMNSPQFNKGIKLLNVSFHYPNSDKNVLENVSFNINAGETVAIVGENGAGKTTLVRLITGILKPTYGQVLIDDVPTSEIETSKLFANTTGIIQKFQKYKMTLKNNIIISHMDKQPDEDRMTLSMHESDVKIDKRFTEGIDTILSKEFDGIDLSGGEWQRLAIARGLYKNHELIVLDEPTSAIDPIEESKIYKKFAEISSGKTAIIITHRLGSTKIADKIVVVNNGSIDAIGTHQELMVQNGLYANMFNSQAKWYGVRVPEI